MLLTDIAISHTKKSRNGGPDQTFVLHPFENSHGVNAGKYEMIRNVNAAGQPKVKRSMHVTKTQLAELYARGLVESLGLRLRLRSADGSYPTAPPGKKVPSNCIEPGSSFDQLVKSIDISAPMSDPLVLELNAVADR